MKPVLESDSVPWVEARSDRKTVLSETLRRRIISMEMPPGAIVDETALGEEFEISRAPVRELLRQLAAEGYVELEANRAARVCSMSLDSLKSFFRAASLVYVATARLAAANATRADVNALKAIQQRFRAAIEQGDLEGRIIHNNDFHLQIGTMASNAYLLPSLRRLLIDHARLGKTFYRHPADQDMQQDLEKAVDQHDGIIDAIERHDADAAAEQVRAHMALSRHRMAQYAAPEGAEILRNC